MKRRHRLARPLVPLLLAWAAAAAHAHAPGEEAPGAGGGLALPEPPAAVQRLLAADLPPVEANARRIEHGRWEQIDAAALTAPQEAGLLRRAGVHPDRWPQLGDDPAVRLERAAAWWLHGRPEAALGALPAGIGVPLRAECLAALGRHAEAVEALRPLLGDGDADPVDRARALLLADRLGSAGPDASRRAAELLDRAVELDPLSARPRRAQAALFFSRDNRPGGGAALEAALARDPLDPEALRLLGEVALDGFDAARAELVAQRLDALPGRLPPGLLPGGEADAAAAAGHPLTPALRARARLRADDAAGAAEVLRAAGPDRRDLLPLLAAAEAVRDPGGPAAEAALSASEAAAPGSPAAHAAAGAALAEARLYPEAVAHLEEAIRRLPSDPRPRHELGRVLGQAGDLPAAVAALREAVRLDPFQSDAQNSLALFEEMLGWPVVETEHFRVRHRPGPDAVLAADVAREVEAVRTAVASFFDHEPANPTQVDLLPDAPSFAVRITGRPEIWTIAACTGDVIAMTPPRLGPDQAGGFHWRNVLRHEYAHTVTLDRTGNRIAHWLTEAAAVNAESVGRSYDQALLLAAAFHADGLFAYEDLNLGFIRPEKPTDRPLAYAQSAWMLEHLVEVDGRAAMLRMLDAAAAGASDAEALRAACGLTPDAFMERFRPWAAAALERWGLGAGPPPADAAEAIAAAQAADNPAAASEARRLLRLLSPEAARHPDALEAAARLESRWGAADAAATAVERYALARPADPWPHTALADAALAAGDADAAAAHLAVLERSDGMTARSARLLMELYSREDRPAEGLGAALNALLRQPYDPGLREQAAALALRAGDWAEAAYQVRQLTRLEPDEPRHAQRLAAIEAKRPKAEAPSR